MPDPFINTQNLQAQNNNIIVYFFNKNNYYGINSLVRTILSLN